ncbi:cilia- and flagella-associated protein 99-like, partial [Atheta coriaria]|uniref:cilia- and flagella-associated protein 99-like n=1 Tax=Dalotia coriaria TaxID=877792 RepID=UPI0031F3D3FC
MTNTLSQDLEKKKLAGKKSLTKPYGPSLLDRKTVPVKTEKVSRPPPFESTPVPKTTYKPNDQEKLLEKARANNRKMAYELLAEAKKLNLKCAEPKALPKPSTPVVYKPIIAKPPPKFDPVEVKATTASLMRQAAFLTKEKTAEIKEIESLINGTLGDMTNSTLLEELRRAKENELLQDIERKHLQGLLTREEAILAKQRLFQKNQLKKQQYQEERIKLLETIDKYRRKEEEKNRELVEKVQAIENAAKDAEVKLLKERRCNAKLIEYETQILLKQANEEREEELTKKIQIIKELKLLQQINAGNNKVEFDPTETSNLGLMCEMSIAELQERLALLKVTMKEELEERKAKILTEKKKQQTMLEQMKEFVETAKGQK